ncbi:MAG: hypothetical protein ABIQ11_01265 [Saprospiraceae bacterium]
MNVEFDKSFQKWLNKLNETNTLKKIKQAIPNTRKLSGHKNYYRIKIGDHGIGFERIS